MSKIVKVCLGKKGRSIVIAMLNTDGKPVAATWASDGKPLPPDSLEKIELHTEWGSITIS